MARPSFLGNKYWVLRHGKSIPNEKGLIVSSMENGTLEEYKLAPEGVNQALLAGELFQKVGVPTNTCCGSPGPTWLSQVDMLKSDLECIADELEENKIPLENARICYSPFSRTRHTAKAVASVLNVPFEGPQCKMIEDLRERFFGPSFELTSHDKYSEIWALDAKDPFMKPEGGESVSDVVSRLTSALITIESEFQGCAILVVSHGDPLQILQTILNAAKEHTGPSVDDLASRIQAVKVPSVLSLHRKFSLLTGELRAVI